VNQNQKVTERKGGTRRVQTVNKEPDMTKQSFRDECDINHIINRYDNTGLVTHLNPAPAVYADVTGIRDYHDALNIVVQASQAFEALPAKIRTHFNNDPGEFLDAAQDPDRREELAGLGLVPSSEGADVAADAGVETDVGGFGTGAGGAPVDEAPGGAGPAEPSAGSV